ncbi:MULTISPECIES: glutathione synthase [Nostocaceae]|uniref:Glutathione synthetase n=3 Tax=Nostocaceae TaxID=1162 RepID=GSHB_NOSS1|nr:MULTISPECIES: glutathione synthase [Nostocaceae]P45480.2 RecName: Full=Glutathione synthetase; AltName: Full=GSH synthetase; Short=GSH-S; Short=GSHase; AltName: Full=Glutathione synthase [Nostoc sp. PCC 7120 = FACHB-418]BAY69486.1 glutathione synthetase [Trichormus variabilis NIES-23]HBW30088.1 glutathione synthase [Nostoc sp. UBA8866]MBD2171048.1 glutathione synthase [Anabaena cylindrica FACHB-318]MBD2283427.1 glutathione synthase [Anabaena cylindrica FACHB-170]MBD2348141.1 glutathione sy
MKLAFIIDPIHQLDPCHDTSVALMEAAQILGHEVWVTQANWLSVVDSKAWAILQQVELVPVQLIDGRWVAASPWYTLNTRSFSSLETMDAVFMRTDPPVNDAYLYATYVLDYVDQRKTLVINNPNGIRGANEKMYALQFTKAIPETIVSADKDFIRQFVEAKGATVLKPLGNKAGEGILFLQAGDRNFNSIVELSTQQGRLPVMVQTYLPEAKEGDKRIILLNGEPIGALNRLASGSDFRNNMATGGTVAKTEITPREEEICSQIAANLRQDGLIFVGIDVIGGYLTEVNVTSPTGIREIDRLDGTRLAHQVIQWVEKNLQIQN